MSKSDVKMEYTTLADEVRAALPPPMPKCSVCSHPRRAEIDDCLRQKLPISAIVRTLKQQFCESSLRRHRNNHLGVK